MPLSAQLAVYQGSPAAQAVSCLGSGRGLCRCGLVVTIPAGLSHGDGLMHAELQEAQLHLISPSAQRPSCIHAGSCIHSPLITSRDT